MTDVQPDNQAAIDFLLRVYPEGPWLLTAIQTDRKAISTETFFPATVKDLEAWLGRFNGVRNIYWSVNPPMQALNKKAEREDIRSVNYLHVDVDPRAGEDLDEEIKRIRELRPSGLPEPTFTIYSGGGCQFFWKLQEPIEINGDLEKAEDAKRYNQHIEVCYGGDNCHNIDRIMRLPGTVNVPDAKKLKKGRKPALACLTSWTDEAFPVDRFPKAAQVQLLGDQVGKGLSGASSSKTQPKVELSGNIIRLTDIDELDQWDVGDRVKLIIIQGQHPDEPKKWTNGGRSEWVFDVCCNLHRKGVPDEVIYSVITDPSFSISSSVLEGGGRRAHNYAVRQIGRAKEFSIDPKLMEMNEKFAVISNIGGKCRVVEEVVDPVRNRTRLTRQSFEDFSNRHRNQKVNIGKPDDPQYIKLGVWWLDHPNRRQYDTLVFAPEIDTPGQYNLWRGFACEQKPGSCEKFLHHVRENICSGNQEHYDYLVGWMARAVQRPAEPGYVAIVLRGEKGTGKGVFAKAFGSLYGRHFLQVANPTHLVGNFNSHLRDVCVLFADEAFYANDKKHESVLKMLVTEETIPIEAKGVDLEECPNYVHLIMASNEEHVIPASGLERRYFVLQIGEAQVQNTTYFKAVADELNNGGREALLHFLRTYDISEFNVSKVPQTDALADQKERSLPAEADWWLNKLKDGTMFHNASEWPEAVRKQELFDDYANYARNWMVAFKRLNMNTLGKYVASLCPGLTSEQRLAEFNLPTADGFGERVTRRTYFWVLPDLATCRAAWDKRYGKYDWPAALSGGTQAKLKEPF